MGSNSILGSILDKNLEKVEFNLSAKIIIIGLVIISTFIFMWFSFVDPWIDVFMQP